MKLGTALDDIIEERLLALHTAFIAKIESVKNGKAKIQPLSMIKQYGEDAIQPAVLEDVPIPKSLYKIEIVEWEAEPAGSHPTHKHTGHVELVPVEAGDIVLCVCVDRDITDTQNGSMALPIIGHHEMKDAIIVHVLSEW